MYHLELVTLQCENSTAPLELSIVSATVSSLLLVVTVPTNLLVCLAILINPNKDLKTQFNCFTFNLAFADLMVGCITEAVSIYAHVTEALNIEHKQAIHKIILDLFHIPYFISAMASVLSITVLALERYLAITSPFRYRRYFSIKLCVLISIIIWAISVTFGLFSLTTNYIFESFIFVNTGVLLTTLIVCFASCKIRHSMEEISNNLASHGECNHSIQQKNDSTQAKLTKTFSLMIGALLCCYIPACCLIYYMNLCQQCDCDLVQWFRDISFWLILLNSATNPFIYALRSSSFRKAIKDIVCCRCYKKRKLFPVMRYSKRTSYERLTTHSHAIYGSVSTDSDGTGEGVERVHLQYH